MVATFIVAALDWNATPLLDWTRYIVALPLGLTGLFITVCGYFNLGLGNTYCGADGLVTGGLYRFSRNPQYTASIIGLIGLSIGANSILTIIMSAVMSGAYVMMALVEEDWLKQLYGAPYRDYCRETSRFLDVQGLLALLDRKKPSRQSGLSLLRSDRAASLARQQRRARPSARRSLRHRDAPSRRAPGGTLARAAGRGTARGCAASSD